LSLIEEDKPAPQEIEISSHDSLVKLVKSECKHFVTPTFIRIDDEREITVLSTYCTDDKYNRRFYYAVKCGAPSFAPGWYEREDAMIKLMSVFIQNEGSNYILDLIGKLSQNSSIETDDNGITQKVTMKAGIEIKASTAVKPIVALKPYRTFLESNLSSFVESGEIVILP
jgi:hypothetical protein